jgi:hypothetical protein
MKLFFLILWLAGGAMVALASVACVNWLRACEARQEAEHQAVWNLLVSKDSL